MQENNQPINAMRQRRLMAFHVTPAEIGLELPAVIKDS
jgi:hypothetical protein